MEAIEKAIEKEDHLLFRPSHKKGWTKSISRPLICIILMSINENANEKQLKSISHFLCSGVKNQIWKQSVDFDYKLIFRPLDIVCVCVQVELIKHIYE